MKKPSTIVSFVVIITLSVVLGAWLFAETRAKTDQSDNISVNKPVTNALWQEAGQGVGGTRYVSEQYGFSLSLPAVFSDRLESPYGSEKLSVKFTRTNANVSEEHNRNSPDGFNTVADDIILLRAYANNNGLTVQQSDQIKNWITVNLPSETETTLFETRTVGNNTVIFAHQLNGIGATGQYFYFISPETILVMDSNDVPEEELQAIAATVTLAVE